jgi:hypothetical protein
MLFPIAAKKVGPFNAYYMGIPFIVTGAGATVSHWLLGKRPFDQGNAVKGDHSIQN